MKNSNQIQNHTFKMVFYHCSFTHIIMLHYGKVIMNTFSVMFHWLAVTLIIIVQQFFQRKFVVTTSSSGVDSSLWVYITIIIFKINRRVVSFYPYDIV